MHRSEEDYLFIMKQYKWQIILSSILVFLPAAAGLCLLAIGAGSATSEAGGIASSVADGRLKAMIVTSLFCLLNHFLAVWLTLRDPKNRKRNQQMIGFIFWICPIISIFSCGTMYRIYTGASADQGTGISVCMGLMFIALGNYLPKTGQNHTVGIRVPWTLADEENWNATHRFGGRVWVVGGFLTMIGSFLPGALGHRVVPAALLVVALAPIVYSYLYHRRQRKQRTLSETQTSQSVQMGPKRMDSNQMDVGLKNAGQASAEYDKTGNAEKTAYSRRAGHKKTAYSGRTGHEEKNAYGESISPETKNAPLARKRSIYATSAISLGILAVILIGTAVLMLTGNIRCEFADDAFTINAFYWDDLTVAYDEIDSLELREYGVPGYRSFGFGNMRLGMGTFENEEFGSYTRYTYAGSRPCLVIESGGETLVLNGKNEAETLALYERLKTEISN